MKARTSCDACHSRKTRCDLGERIAEATSNASASTSYQAGLSCSFCSSLGVPCRVTKKTGSTLHSSSIGARKTGKHKKGKIIRELLADAAQDLAVHSNDTQGEGVADLLAPFDAPLNNAHMKPALAARIDPATLGTSSSAASSIHKRSSSFMGVPGLTAAALRDCIQGFYDSLHIWMPLTLDHEEFMKRYKLFLQDVQGLERDRGEDGTLAPLSELLVLAVASRGAPFRPSHAHLERPLYDRAATLARQPDYQGLEELDGIEAVALLSERYSRPMRSVPQGGQHPSTTVLDPFGKGFAAELCLFAKLNEEAPPFSSDFHRRARLFWVIFCHDALRSASACRIYRMHDEDVGWPMRMSLHREPIVALALIARKICRNILSSRARCLGIQSSDINAVLDDLASWPDTVNIPVDSSDFVTTTPSSSSSIPGQPAFQSTSSSSWPTGYEGESPDSVDGLEQQQQQQHQLRVKRCIAIGFWLRLNLSIWTFLYEIGYLASSDIMIRVEHETARAARRMVNLAKVCVELNLVDYGPNALLTTSAAWVLYLIRKISDLRGAKSRADAASAQAINGEKDALLDMARVLLSAVRSAKTRPEAESLAARLEIMLRRASVVPLKDITRLAESSTADLQSSVSSAVEMRTGLYGRKRRAAEGHGGPAAAHQQQANEVDRGIAAEQLGVGSDGNEINGAEYLQQQESSIMGSFAAPQTQLSGHMHYSRNDKTPSHDSRGANAAMQSLAPGFPTGLGEEGDEDYLTLMVSCGFDMPLSFLQVVE